MQDNKEKKAKKKRALVYKPYLKGNWHSAYAARKGLRILMYYLVFVFLYLILGATLQFEQAALRIVTNALLVAVCAALLYMDGARLGESEVAFGEIAFARQESGKEVSAQDRDRCYHPLKGVFIFLVGIAPLLLLGILHAVLAEKQVYTLQGLPSWVSSFSGHEEVTLPLSYYEQTAGIGGKDILRIVARILVFPFANIATADNADALLLVDRLSPLLICLPALGFPLGYLTGPRSRAMVHGDIKTSERRHLRRQKKAIKARQQRQPKKNELI